MTGLYTSTTIQAVNVAVDCLVDTEATLSLISSELWESFKSNATLEQYNDTFISASGDNLHVLGKTRFTLSIHGI